MKKLFYIFFFSQTFAYAQAWFPFDTGVNSVHVVPASIVFQISAAPLDVAVEKGAPQ